MKLTLLLAILVIIGCAGSREIIKEQWSPSDGMTQAKLDSLCLDFIYELEAAVDSVRCTTGVE